MATKFETISHMIWRLLTKCQIKWEIVSNFCGLFWMFKLSQWAFNLASIYFFYQLVNFWGQLITKQNIGIYPFVIYLRPEKPGAFNSTTESILLFYTPTYWPMALAFFRLYVVLMYFILQYKLCGFLMVRPQTII